MTVSYQQIYAYLAEIKDPKIAEHSQRFFKTGEGEYGDGDQFLGIRVPTLRKAAKIFKDTPETEIKKLLKSGFHEIRLLSLIMLVNRFSIVNDDEKEKIYDFYLAHTKFINNWDLVDSSAHSIVGAWLFDKDRSDLYQLVASKNLWERRISIISTFYFIKQGDFSDALNLSKILISDTEDLIHKAVGWMLREIGNRDIDIEENFLKQHYQNMPRTMLRYSIEKFDNPKRQAYLKGEL